MYFEPPGPRRYGGRVELDHDAYFAHLAQERLELGLLEWRPDLHPRDPDGKFTASLGQIARLITNSIGVDPFDVDIDKLYNHAELCAAPPQSRFKFKSPCWAIKDLDFGVHVWLPSILSERYPDLSKTLAKTSPRWGRKSHPHGWPIRFKPINPRRRA